MLAGTVVDANTGSCDRGVEALCFEARLVISRESATDE
jgi:hypothetical protein